MTAGGRALITAGMKPDSTDPSQCQFCHWWSPHRRVPGSQLNGLWDCRRHSPDAADRSTHHHYAKWPATYGYEWCGDFERFRNADGTPNTASHSPGA